MYTPTAVSVQGLPADCQAEVDVEKRDNPEEIDFVVCVKQGMSFIMTISSTPFIHWKCREGLHES